MTIISDPDFEKLKTRSMWYHTSQDGFYKIDLEVQVDVENKGGGHTWYIFIHSTNMRGKKPFVTQYKKVNIPLYDALYQVIVEFDMIYSTKFYANCLVKGDWGSQTTRGVIEMETYKLGIPARAWYFRMFDEEHRAKIVAHLTSEQYDYLFDFL